MSDASVREKRWQPVCRYLPLKTAAMTDCCTLG